MDKLEASEKFCPMLREKCATNGCMAWVTGEKYEKKELIDPSGRQYSRFDPLEVSVIVPDPDSGYCSVYGGAGHA